MSFDVSDIPSITVFAMMLGMGMTLAPRDFVRVGQAPAAFVLGASGQLLALPLAAFAIASLLRLESHHALGLVLIAACPGAATSNPLSYFARGDVALSVSLTALSSALAFLTLPFILGLGAAWFTDGASAITLPFVETASKLASFTIVPVAGGMFVRARWPRLASRTQGPLIGISTGVVLLLVVALGSSLTARDEDWLGLFSKATPPVLALLASMLAFSLLGARLLRLDRPRTRTIALEVSLQNFSLAMAVALTILERPDVLGVPLLYLPVMLAAAGVIALTRGRTEPSGSGRARHSVRVGLGVARDEHGDGFDEALGPLGGDQE